LEKENDVNFTDTIDKCELFSAMHNVEALFFSDAKTRLGVVLL